MQTPVHRKHQPPRAWLIPAIVAAILLIAGVAGSLISNHFQASFDPYRRWVWISFGSALIAAIAAAIREARRVPPSAASSDDPQTASEHAIEGSSGVSTQGERSMAIGGDVKGSAIITGDKNLAVVDSQVAGDVVAGDKITHIHEAAIPVATARHQLRSPVGDFVGREQEIATLVSTLHAGNHAGISGMGGTGKTELALLVAERVSAEYPDAQLFINLQGNDPQPRRPEEALATFIRAFLGPEAKLPDDLNQLTQLYLSQLSEKRVLIVLDNAGDGAQVRPLLPPVGCVLVVTSRPAVAVQGMISLTLNPFTALEGSQLLLEIAPRATPVADQISQLCGYLPLAIRAAGSLLAVTVDLEAEDYLAQLKEERTRLKLIGMEGVEVDLEASFNLSYGRLESEAARVFRYLSIFPATFDAAAEELVCDDDEHIHLRNLVRRSLVLYEASAKRYRLHDLTRLFAASRLGVDERTNGARLHALHYKWVLEDAGDLYLKGGETVGGALTLLDLEWRNIQAGQAWVQAEAGANEQTAELCIGYSEGAAELLSLRQLPREQIRWLEGALAAARRLEDRRSEGNALGNLGLAYTDLGEPRRAIEFHEQALLIDREVGNRGGESAALGNLGAAYMVLGETRRAIEFHEQALLIDREIDDRRSEGAMLGNLGIAYSNLGETRRAIEFYGQALVIARETGDRRREGATLGNLGTAYTALGETRRAIEFSEQHLAIAREMGDRGGERAALTNLGAEYMVLGEIRRAIEFHEQALLVARETDDRGGEARTLGGLGVAYAGLGETRRDIEFYEEQLVIVRELGDRRGEENALGNLGSACIALGEATRAIEVYEQQLAIVRELGDGRRECYANFNKGLALDMLGERAQAIAGAEAALTILEQLEDPDAVRVRAQLAEWRSETANKGPDVSEPVG